MNATVGAAEPPPYALGPEARLPSLVLPTLEPWVCPALNAALQIPSHLWCSHWRPVFMSGDCTSATRKYSHFLAND